MRRPVINPKSSQTNGGGGGGKRQEEVKLYVYMNILPTLIKYISMCIYTTTCYEKIKSGDVVVSIHSYHKALHKL